MNDLPPIADNLLNIAAVIFVIVMAVSAIRGFSKKNRP